MKKENTAIPDNLLVALSNQYRDCINMLSQTNNRRTASARFFISLVSGLVGLLAMVQRLGTDVETQVWLTNFISLSSIFLSCVWFMIIRALRHRARVQRTLIAEMEQSLPFAFISRQGQILEKASGWLNPGLIEQYLPLFMMIPAIIIMLVANFS